MEEKVANLKAQLEQSLLVEEVNKLQESHEKEVEMLQREAEERADQTRHDCELDQQRIVELEETLKDVKVDDLILMLS